ncbi:MAG TPA: ABC transporter permease subunit [Acidimicrobiia bacterium]|nr:ABC transporter permease subunit [Acidimicrobiia bacterium]
MSSRAEALTTSRTVEAVENKMPVSRWFRELGWRHLVGLVGVLFALYPVAWIVSAAFNSVQSLVSARLIPRSLTTENFTSLFGNATTPFARWIGNSYKVALTAAIINVLLASLAAYAFSRMRFRGRRMGLLALLLVQVFPQFLGFIALFLLAQQIGEVFPQAGLGTHLFLIMVYLGGAIGFNAFLIKGFMDTIPASLDESARVDGAGPFQIFWSVVFPLARPVLAVIFIITFTNLFAEYILASTLITSTANYTMPVGLQLFVSSDYSAKWGNLAAAALIGAAPIVATFLIAQKQIIGGLTTGAVKG